MHEGEVERRDAVRIEVVVCALRGAHQGARKVGKIDGGQEHLVYEHVHVVVAAVGRCADPAGSWCQHSATAGAVPSLTSWGEKTPSFPRAARAASHAQRAETQPAPPGSGEIGRGAAVFSRSCHWQLGSRHVRREGLQLSVWAIRLQSPRSELPSRPQAGGGTRPCQARIRQPARSTAPVVAANTRGWHTLSAEDYSLPVIR